MSSRRRVKFKFVLYVANNTQNSEAARANLAILCAHLSPDHCEIEVVDVLRDPERALREGVLMTPTLVRLLPLPVLKLVGTLSQTDTVIRALGIENAA